MPDGLFSGLLKSRPYPSTGNFSVLAPDMIKKSVHENCIYPPANAPIDKYPMGNCLWMIVWMDICSDGSLSGWSFFQMDICKD